MVGRVGTEVLVLVVKRGRYSCLKHCLSPSCRPSARPSCKSQNSPQFLKLLPFLNLLIQTPQEPLQPPKIFLLLRWPYVSCQKSRLLPLLLSPFSFLLLLHPALLSRGRRCPLRSLLCAFALARGRPSDLYCSSCSLDAQAARPQLSHRRRSVRSLST